LVTDLGEKQLALTKEKGKLTWMESIPFVFERQRTAVAVSACDWG
jgi:hypothetical protein